jgi:hypothetical protein
MLVLLRIIDLIPIVGKLREHKFGPNAYDDKLHDICPRSSCGSSACGLTPVKHKLCSVTQLFCRLDFHRNAGQSS